MKSQPPEPELSRPLKVDRVPVGGMEERIIATPEEREALRKRFNLLELSRFEAFLSVDREQGAMLAVTGKVTADVMQECVVTLEPIPEKVEEAINTLFAPSHLIKEAHEGGFSDMGEVDPPEPIVNGVIDLGELAAQHMAMALNPYPRKVGASLGSIEVTGKGLSKGADSAEDVSGNTRKPFAVLQGLIEKKE